MDVNRKQMLAAFREVIEGLSDKDYQKKAWVIGDGVGFDEAVNLFSDLGDPIIDKYKEFGLTEYQCEVLKNFREQFKVFYEEHDLPQEFIESLEWARIIEMAKQLLKVFK